MSDRKFGIFFGIFLCLIMLVIWHGLGTLMLEMAIIGGLFVVTAIVAPWILLPLNRLWLKLTRAIGHGSNYFILGTVYYILLTPMSFVFRLIGRDTMCRKFEPSAESYLRPVEKMVDAKSLRDWF